MAAVPIPASLVKTPRLQPTRKAQKAYTKQVEQQIKEEYTPVLKKMTRSQGKVLLKLIARETEYSSYEIVREFRGGFTAGFWQGVAVCSLR